MKINFYKAINENSGIYLHKSLSDCVPDIGDKVIVFGKKFSVIDRTWRFTTSGDNDCVDVFLKDKNNKIKNKEVFVKIKSELEELFLGNNEEDSCTTFESYFNSAICAALSVIDKIEKEYE